jgi:hypothetical protein
MNLRHRGEIRAGVRRNRLLPRYIQRPTIRERWRSEVAMPNEHGLFERNPALKLVLSHAALGSVFGLVFAVVLVLLDAHGLGTLLRRSDSAVVAFVLLAGGFMITFGSLVAGSAIMLLPDDGDDGHGGGGPGRHRRESLLPIRVRSRSRR